MAAPARLREPATEDRAALARLYSFVWAAAWEETGDDRVAGRVARRAFLMAQAEGIPK